MRAMQVGGNAAATAYFRQHGCNAKEAHAKYQSRAAQLYREKLNGMAIETQRKYGTQLHIETHHPGETKQEDFFTSAISQAQQQTSDFSLDMSVSATAPKPQSPDSHNGSDQSRQPNVSCLHSPSSPSAPTAVAAKESTEVKMSHIGKRKAPPKSGLGARKGLGGQKIKNFSEIEAEAEQQKQLDQQQFAPVNTTPVFKEDFPQDVGYREPKNLDPRKAKQAERLGMGVGRISSQSHSASAGMDTIDQSGPIRTNQNRMDRMGASSRVYGGYDSYRSDDYGSKGSEGCGSGSRFDPPSYSSGSYGNQERDRDSFYAQKTSKHSVFANQASTSTGKPSSQVYSFGSIQGGGDQEGRGDRSTSAWRVGTGSAWGAPASGRGGGGAGSKDAQQRFANAKSISSDQYFGRSTGGGTWESGDANMSQFAGSSSISSDQYFGRNERKQKSSEGPDMSGLKESVSNLGSKVSAAAGRMMESIQDRYHGYTS